nr:MAG: RNA dependent RNA polymerase [Ustilaginoidea virens narna-like virus 3]
MSTRWCPPLPSLGRAGPRINVEPSSTLLQRLEEYYCEHRSVPDIFERRVSRGHQRRALRYRGDSAQPRFLSDMSPAEQQSVLLRNLYFKLSAASRTKMRRELDKGQLHHVRSWFHTANAAVLPLLLTSEREESRLLPQVDVLTNWVLENSAHNYALFSRDFKTLKKRMRKSYAIHMDFDHVETKASMMPYLNIAKDVAASKNWSGPAEFGRFVLTWTQTRATGMANQRMIRDSLDKLVSTVTDPGGSYTMRPDVLRDVTIPAIGAQGIAAKVSVGTTACLESTRQRGGKTKYLSFLAQVASVRSEYNFETLDETPVTPRPVRSSTDLVNWAVYVVLHNPTYVRCVRAHAVAEPGKARTITVAPYAYQVLMGVFAHVFQPCLRSKDIRSGLKADRHLWRFLQETLNPQKSGWENLTEGSVWALSTDLSEATDWGSKPVARQIWHALITHAMCEGFPLALAVLAKTLYCSDRFLFRPVEGNRYSLHTAKRGWLMGDMMTKVILTLAHQYCCKLTGLVTYTLVGDDEIAVDNDKRLLERHVNETLPLIFKVSEDDTYVSSHLAFYCEEGTVLPQYAHDTTHVRMRRGQELLYLDYPRIRLLLPQIIETDAYSMTNIGRFALLGKETRWVCNVNADAQELFARAQLLQHILIPQEPDTLCPYTPIEIGGDGAFPHSAEFMRKVVEDKSIDPRETKYRLSALINQRFGYKFVRSNRLDKVVNKHHLYLPKIEKLREILPEDSIVAPDGRETRLMLESVRFDNLADPQSIFFEIAKGLYYKALLEGKDPPEPVFSIDRQFSAGHTHEPTLDFHVFRDTWMNPGFKFQNSWGYWVLRDKIPTLNPMNLGWNWDKCKYPNAREILDLWVKENVSFELETLPDLLSLIRDKRPLPKRVVDRLNLFIESDAYIMRTLNESYVGDVVALISRDQRLGLRIKKRFRNLGHDVKVIVIDPAIYMIGRTEEVYMHFNLPGDPGYIIEDPGAMLHVDYTEFTDGFPHREDVWDCQLRQFVNRHGVSVALL